MSLTDEEKQVLNWLSEKRNNEVYSISQEDFVSKVEDIVGKSFEDIDNKVFRFNLIGVTVTIEDGQKMYPIRDLEQGITRGYSTD